MSGRPESTRARNFTNNDIAVDMIHAIHRIDCTSLRALKRLDNYFRPISDFILDLAKFAVCCRWNSAPPTLAFIWPSANASNWQIRNGAMQCHRRGSCLK
jgi:aminoglycoside phosphotransferase (APT) family kinase protein